MLGAESLERGAESLETVQIFLSARTNPCFTLRALRYFAFKFREKPVIIRQTSSRSCSSSSRTLLSINPLASKTITILAFSNAERRAIFKKLAKSLFDEEPDPSLRGVAIL